MLHTVTGKAGAQDLYHVTRRRMPLEAFASLLAYDLSPDTRIMSVEATRIAMKSPVARSHETRVYEDTVEKMQPLVAAVAYHAYITHNMGVADLCEELLEGSAYVPRYGRLDEAEGFMPNAAIALAVADIKPEVHLILRSRDIWSLAMSVALIFENPSEEWRETVIAALLEA